MVTHRNNYKKDIKYYLNLPWTYTIETTNETGETLYIVHVNELPGISTDAPSIEEAMQLIKEAMQGAFEMYLEDGEEIPEPTNKNDYKGNIAYRTTPSRHFLIAREAKKRNISLSQAIDTFIDKAYLKSSKPTSG